MKTLHYKIALGLLLVTGAAFARMNPGKAPQANPAAATKVQAGCVTTTAQTDLAINNVRARILVGGDLWWDPVGQQNYYEVPRGSGKNSIYTGALWIGGIDASNQLKVAAQTYRQSAANDFWGGPISKVAGGPSYGEISSTRCDQFDRFWVVDRDSVENFINTGVPTNAIVDWPGNGDVSNGELPFLAPFFDANNDGVYNYEDGDYPYYQFGEYPKDQNGKSVCDDYLFGDRTIWWVFNDVGGSKTETNSDPIGLEVRAQAFAFKTNDEINNMTFYQYQVINRSNDSLTQTYFGVWCDPDLGNATDDYVGCDVSLGLGYVYNGDPFDDGGAGYGNQPPCAGIDFFKGPLADANDGIDNNHDGQIDEVGETCSMSKFVYYVNTNGIPTGNPAVTDDYYDYLSGFWLDGQQITYGGDGRGGGLGATSTPCNFMFPDNTDIDMNNAGMAPWTMVTAGIQPDDMRFLESAGTFSLAPGAVNYIKDGVVWSQANSGGPLASVRLAKSADIKAQKLFNSCFELKDGPAAPDLVIREMDQKLIMSLEGLDKWKSEDFNYQDPNIPAQVLDVNGNVISLSADERSYKFEGYRIYQVASSTIKSNELTDESKAKLVAQYDLENGFTTLVNYVKNDELGFYEPVVKTSSVNAGIQHTFELTTDLFTQKTLANYRPCYYTVIAYAANNFQTFNQAVPNYDLNTQAETYLEGRKNVAIYSAIPHKQVLENGGLVLQSDFGTGINVRRIEGAGNSGHILDFTQASVDELMSDTANRVLHPVYQGGRAPIDVTVFDPERVKTGGFTLAMTGVTTSDSWYLYANPASHYAISNLVYSGNVITLTTATDDSLSKGQYIRLFDVAGISPATAINAWFKVDSVANNSTCYLTGTLTGSWTSGTGYLVKGIMKNRASISSVSDQLIDANKLRLKVGLNANEPGVTGAPNNGFLEATQEFADAGKNWLTGIVDVDVASTSSNFAQNWIAAGPAADVDGSTNLAGDDAEVYEGVLGGTWAPYKLVSRQGVGAPKFGSSTMDALCKWSSLQSVDVVFTSDKSKWTRCVVVETGEDTMPTQATVISCTTAAGSPWLVNSGTVRPLLGQQVTGTGIPANAKVSSVTSDGDSIRISGNATAAGTVDVSFRSFKFDRRNHASVDKEGRAYGSAGANNADAGLTDSIGMGWFPGYAYSLETGERLNIIFGENSALTGENGTDMIWNPTTNAGKDANGRISEGGMHFLYIVGHNANTATDVPLYDKGAFINTYLKANLGGTNRRNVYKDVVWATLPVLAANHSLNESDVKVRLRVVKNMRTFLSKYDTAVNNQNPMFEFEVSGDVLALTNQDTALSRAVDLIRVVPNPYYAYSSYEKTVRDQLDNRVRIVNLPPNSTVSIYTVNGTLVRQYKHAGVTDASDGFAVASGLDFNAAHTLDWDLKNTAGITVASGIYLIHIDAGAAGSKTIKWFGIMRPIDLDSF